ncbi:MAG: hypothetical protein L3J82_09670 [Planctomycetes bacterium]|nr:hypothetical protein [Planctomycetota bacterium]
MKRFIKTVFIVGLCGVGTIALAHAVLGKHRTHDAAKALQSMAQGSVDELIANQQDMRKELQKLRKEYPKQIAFMRHQIAEIDRELDVTAKSETKASDIIRLCEKDISYLQAQQSIVAESGSEARVIEHRGALYSAIETQVLVNRIEETRNIYIERATESIEQRAILVSEKEALSLELEAIRTEQAEFEAEYQSLVREIERLKRNEEMLKLTEKRRGMGSERHGHSMETLSHVKSAIERARMEQEERLKAAKIAPRNMDYETRARLLELQRRREAKRKTEPTPEAQDSTEDDSISTKNDEESETFQFSE